ncbi:S-layer homology domain-containing protein [Paenibacillus sp. HWE-109]|uniref:S-layer homology domain-containing protein n=1 Tax=Paenibacillus sp. HWE-109 TaxID=1306526 RepID=UPI001EE12401|nr:S-layer homology domain-containing protein [Paenibacillus sp. HWE-109]UKS29758.1 S-layer homology domain-containing protein [Paenibacillus sp. HWE-109]
MKKTLTVALTSAMALSMFSSVAFGKSSSDYTDLSQLDTATKAKFDAMISAGIVDGITETTFGLKSQMNRAQFAKVAALLLKLPVNAGLRVSSYTDVSTYDQANGYALPYIEALKTAGITEGTSEWTYSPAAQVTKQELAAFFIRILGKEAQAEALTLTDGSVSDWAKGYVALATSLKILPESVGAFEGLQPATRELLVTGAYETKQQYVPDKVSLIGAQAIGASTVKVWVNDTVDTKKATFMLSKGSMSVPVTATWSDDHKWATLVSASPLSEGDYTVEISGIDSSSVLRKDVNFRVQKEQVTELKFVNPSDTIANSASASIKVKALNQYGEVASVEASAFTATVAGAAPTDISKDEWGNLVIIADVKATNAAQLNDFIPVTVYLKNQNLNVSRSFKVGNAPILSVIEPNKLTYSNGKTRFLNVGETATITLNLYDQYGNPVTKKQWDNGEVTTKTLLPDINPDNPHLEVVKAGASLSASDLFDTNGIARLEVKLTAKPEQATTHQITIYSENAYATVSVDIN